MYISEVKQGICTIYSYMIEHVDLFLLGFQEISDLIYILKMIIFLEPVAIGEHTQSSTNRATP